MYVRCFNTEAMLIQATVCEACEPFKNIWISALLTYKMWSDLNSSHHHRQIQFDQTNNT